MLSIFKYKARLMHKQYGDDKIMTVCFYDEFLVLIGAAEPEDDSDKIYRRLSRNRR